VTGGKLSKATLHATLKHVIARMPEGSDIERRNRALVAFTRLTGARDSGIASLKLKHVNLAAGSVYQDAREVKTKFSKTETLCQTPEQFKAWSQNLGHEGVLTTFTSYGSVGSRRKGEIIRSLGKPQQAELPSVDEIAKAVARELRGSGSAGPAA